MKELMSGGLRTLSKQLWMGWGRRSRRRTTRRGKDEVLPLVDRE